MKLGDQPVHPTPWEDNSKPNGITLRQEFAKAAMIGLCSNSELINGKWFADGIPQASLFAKWAVEQADALLDELEKTRE